MLQQTQIALQQMSKESAIQHIWNSVDCCNTPRIAEISRYTASNEYILNREIFRVDGRHPLPSTFVDATAPAAETKHRVRNTQDGCGRLAAGSREQV